MAVMSYEPTEVHTKINYFHDTAKPLVPMVIGGSIPPKPQPKIPWPVTITNVAGNEDKYTLDQQGFRYVRHKSCLDSFDDDEEVKRLHYPEMEDLVRRVILETKYLPEPSSIHILTHIIRKGPADGEVITPGTGPLYGVHVDQSFSASKGLAQRFLGDKAEELLKSSRFQIINMWRPIRPITRDPFAVCDAQSVPDSDLIYVPVVFPTHETEAVEVRPPPEERPHRWYYKHNQQPDEVLFFKQVDSDNSEGVPKRVPHCAFNDPNIPQGAGEPRISIEVRALVFYD